MYPVLKFLVLSCALVGSLSCPATGLDNQPYSFTGAISIDITKVPFSRFGSYMAFSEFTQDTLARLGQSGQAARSPGLYLRSAHGDQHPVFRIELVSAGTSVPYHIQASPSVLRLQSERGSVEICISAPDRVRFRGHGVSLRLTADRTALAIAAAPGHWEINSLEVMEKYMLWATQGDLSLDAPWDGVANTHTIATFDPDRGAGYFEGEIDTYPSVWTPHAVTTTIDDDIKSVECEYARWLKGVPSVPSAFGPGAELAAYINWTSVVKPDGFIRRPAMLMSKNWMTAVWSWDHCFNAMATSLQDPALAWDQYMIPFDNQQPEGALPDMVKTSSTQINFTKPPIHGWTLMWMLSHGHSIDPAHLQEIYEPLSRWTNFYFKFRDSNQDGLPEYNHGFDSGWDNSTVFLSGVPVESPDLASFLILQMDALADIAGRLGKSADQKEWQTRSNELLARMLAKFWKRDHFVAFRPDGTEIESDSLFLYLPIILGQHLPPDVRRHLVQGLTAQGRFRTANGFATEALTSRYYTPDGYWRGPIWAPTTMILTEGLDASGEHSLAREIREAFCTMAQKNGMAENFNAITGEGLRDPAYTWTSSVYLIFAHQLLVGSN